MLTLTGVGKRYPTGDRALTDIQLSLPKGQVMALIGPSGAGKSTLIRCVNRLVEPTQGSIRLEDVELTKLSGSRLRHARRSMGMIFQEYALVDRLSVMENVLWPAGLCWFLAQFFTPLPAGSRGRSVSLA
jgi:phosphonate transport system ATP-binding protein